MMITPQQLAESFALNVRLIKMQVNGLTHAESLLQTPYHINSLNWVIGHILVNRERVLELLNEPHLLTESEISRYQTESQPVKSDGPDLIRLERQLELLEQGQAKISSALAQITSEALNTELTIGERQMTVARRLFGLYFHDTYHSGQTDLLRQVAGKNDKII